MTRRQLKVFGVLAVGGVMRLVLVELLKASGALDSISGLDWAYLVVLIVGWLGYPTAIGVAVLRYRLWDINVITRRTVTLAIAPMFVPLRNWVQNAIDRRFNRNGMTRKQSWRILPTRCGMRRIWKN